MLGQKLNTSAVPPCLTLLRPLVLYKNTKVLITQTSASCLHKSFPLLKSPSSARPRKPIHICFAYLLAPAAGSLKCSHKSYLHFFIGLL